MWLGKRKMIELLILSDVDTTLTAFGDAHDAIWQIMAVMAPWRIRHTDLRGREILVFLHPGF